MLGKTINGYIIKEFKGSGSYGSVYSCEKDSKLYAIKIFNFDYVFKQFSSGSDNRITREINALKAVNHPNVVSYVDDGSFIDKIFVLTSYFSAAENIMPQHKQNPEN